MSNDKSIAIVPSSIAEVEHLSQLVCKAGILPQHFQGKPADVAVALMFGIEVGLTPINALQSIYVVHGRPGMYADAMVGLVLSSGKAKYFDTVEVSDQAVTVETHRVGSPQPRRLTVTIEQARKAGWASSNKKYDSEPARMLAARAKSTLCKDVYPDVLRGMASVEDLRDEAEPLRAPPAATVRAPEPVLDAELVDDAAPPADRGKALFERLTMAPTLEELRALAVEIKAAKLPAPQTAELRALYSTRNRQLTQAAAQAQAEADAAEVAG